LRSSKREPARNTAPATITNTIMASRAKGIEFSPVTYWPPV
jgi:hypothetical protein